MQRDDDPTKSARIGGKFLIIAAVISGIFLLANTILDKGLVITGLQVTGPGIQVGAPNLQTPTTSLNSSGECIHPKDLAIQKGWADMGWAAEKFGGLRVGLNKDDTLPDLWEALGPTQIYQATENRHMPMGVWSIYPPYGCRSTLGFSQ